MKNKHETTNNQSSLWKFLKGFTVLTAASSMFGGVSSRSSKPTSNSKELAYSDANFLSQNSTPSLNTDFKMGGFSTNALIAHDTNNKLQAETHVYLAEGDKNSDYEFLTLAPKTSKIQKQIDSNEKYVDENHVLRDVPED